jgi:hypothetical protein
MNPARPPPLRPAPLGGDEADELQYLLHRDRSPNRGEVDTRHWQFILNREEEPVCISDDGTQFYPRKVPQNLN